MHLLGLYLARYVDWCAALSRKFRLWHLFALPFGIVLISIPVMEMAPQWVSIAMRGVLSPILSIALLPVLWAKRKELIKKRDQGEQLTQTQKLLKGFKR